MKVLFFEWNAFMQKGIQSAMKRLGIKYDVYRYIFTDWDKDDAFVDKFEKEVRNGGYDTVFSVNFSPLIADVCNSCEVHYISWVYDCPLHIRRTETLQYNCNDIYFFDRQQALKYRNDGVTGSHHLTLAVDTGLFGAEKTLSMMHTPGFYNCDVSLLGQLYKSDYEYLLGPLPLYYRGYLEGVLSAQMKLAGGYILDEMITDSLMEQLNVWYKKSYNIDTENASEKVMGGRSAFIKSEIKSEGAKVKKEELTYAMCCEATGRDRFMALALLQNRCRVNLYSSDKNEKLNFVNNMGYADYYTQMPQIFAGSRVNLNISLKAIQSGIPLRILDIIGSGGFVISNIQTELFEYFEPDVDIVMYEDMKDLIQKTLYYIEHEQERMAIVKRSVQKVKEAFSFDERIKKMLLD